MKTWMVSITITNTKLWLQLPVQKTADYLIGLFLLCTSNNDCISNVLLSVKMAFKVWFA